MYTRKSYTVFEFANVLNVPCLFLQKFSTKLHALVLKSMVEIEHSNCYSNAYPLAKQAVTGTIAALCILAMKQSTDEGESERELKKVANEHDERF